MERYGEHASPVDLAEARRRLKALSREETFEQLGWYDVLGRPMGVEPWAFGLWVVFDTWTTAN